VILFSVVRKNNSQQRKSWRTAGRSGHDNRVAS